MTTLLQETHEATQQETEPNLSFARVQTKWPRARSQYIAYTGCWATAHVPFAACSSFRSHLAIRLGYWETVEYGMGYKTKPSRYPALYSIIQQKNIQMYCKSKTFSSDISGKCVQVLSTWKQVVLYTCCHEVGDKRAIVIKKTRTLANNVKADRQYFQI